MVTADRMARLVELDRAVRAAKRPLFLAQDVAGSVGDAELERMLFAARNALEAADRRITDLATTPEAP
jgi:hypothetical protein